MSWYKPLLKKESKYKAKRETYDGRSFGSALERARYAELKLLERAGTIKNIECQVQVELSDAKIIYKPDFRYFDCELNETVYEETKGFETPEWRLKRRLWLAYGPGLLRVYKGTAKRLFLHEELRGKRG